MSNKILSADEEYMECLKTIRGCYRYGLYEQGWQHALDNKLIIPAKKWAKIEKAFTIKLLKVQQND